MAKKGIKINVNTHFFGVGGVKMGKNGPESDKNTTIHFFSSSLAPIGIVFVPLHYYYRISEKSTKEIHARMKF